MKTLEQIHNDLVAKLTKLGKTDFVRVNFGDRKNALLEITKLNANLLSLQEITKENKVARHNRKGQVLELLEAGILSINEISAALRISNRNVSSVVCYLRKKGKHIVGTQVGGETFLELAKEVATKTKK